MFLLFFSSKELIDRFLNKDSLILNSYLPDSFAAFNSLVHSDSKLASGMTPTDQRMLSLAIDKQSLNNTLADLNVLVKPDSLAALCPKLIHGSEHFPLQITSYQTSNGPSLQKDGLASQFLRMIFSVLPVANK